ncbi:MAG: hypothetical protein M3Q40_04860 [Pseudomonadota bacterium]|nr:hypothetical protein [Pseudomonadota bacterium]
MTLEKGIAATLVLVLGLWMPTAASAQEVDGEIDSLQLIVQQQRELTADIDGGGIEGLTPREISAIRKSQAKVVKLVADYTRLEDMPIHHKVALDNELERINALVVGGRGALEAQDICSRERRIGTRRMGTRCATGRDGELAREGARNMLEKGKICEGPGCY